MANLKVSLVLYCKTDNGWRRYPIVYGRNGKIRPGFALVGSKPIHFPGGHYELRTYQGSKMVYKNVGVNATDALQARDREAHLLSIRDSAKAAGVTVIEPDDTRVNLRKQRDKFIERLETRGKNVAAESAAVALEDFLEITGHSFADEITEDSVLKFYKGLRKKGNADRTVYNKHVLLFNFFKRLGLDTKKLADRAPSYTMKEVQSYGPDELQTLFSSCRTEYQRIVFETLLKTGLRMQEAMFLEWPNVDFQTKQLHVRERREDGSTIKDRAERSVPMPDDLVISLEAWRKANPKTKLVLGTSSDKPNWKWLPMLKRVVRNAGLNCGRCEGCMTKDECSRWYLHRFRATYATRLLQGGVDVRTVMRYTGHSDLETVLRYLAAAQDAPMQEKISAIKWV